MSCNSPLFYIPAQSQESYDHFLSFLFSQGEISRLGSSDLNALAWLQSRSPRNGKVFLPRKRIILKDSDEWKHPERKWRRRELQNVPDLVPILRRVLPDERFIQQLPCGQCLACRIARKREWAARVLVESLQFSESENYFITLTYDPNASDPFDLLPPIWSISRKTGGEPTLLPGRLQKDHFQRFMKRLRVSFGDGLKFFASGEYGDQSERPHFHAIILGLKGLESDLVFWKRTAHGALFRSPKLESIWGNGNVIVGRVDPHTVEYCTGYVMKKMVGRSEQQYLAACEAAGVEPLPPEFQLMSRRPGLARDWCLKNRETILATGKIPLVDGLLVPSFRYVTDLFARSDRAGFDAKRRFKIQKQELARAAQIVESRSDDERRSQREGQMRRALRARISI